MCGLFFTNARSPKHQQSAAKHAANLKHRGPDHTATVSGPGFWGQFHRLAINDLSAQGHQPFTDASQGTMLLCNGEIYNHQQLRRELAPQRWHSESDCEVLLPLISRYGIAAACRKLDGEFAFVHYHQESGKLLAARDPMGIRPLFYGRIKGDPALFLASEAKALTAWCDDVKPFPPGHLYDGETFVSYLDHSRHRPTYTDDLTTAITGIRQHLTAAVTKRLSSDAPIGALLSGGLDSSLVCALAARHGQGRLKTFAVGTDTDAIDLKYAAEVAAYLGTDHTSVTFNLKTAHSVLRELIYHLETFDITTIRASIGMYLVVKHIKEQTSIKALLTGEVSDELFGYKYTDFAPNPAAFQDEARKRIKEIYLYDVLRADRCIAAHGLEARVPFSDPAFVEHVMAISPHLKMNRWQMGKYLLREAFKGDYLPTSILYREKAAFSDAVGHSVVDSLKAYAEDLYSDRELLEASYRYQHATPITKESLLYREIFEDLYPGRAQLVPAFWLPNQSWANCQVQDPSARALPNYGTSGQ